ncbi:hypothetical protein pb186bvf_015630 [Paramecium bursaria]
MKNDFSQEKIAKIEGLYLIKPPEHQEPPSFVLHIEFCQCFVLQINYFQIIFSASFLILEFVSQVNQDSILRGSSCFLITGIASEISRLSQQYPSCSLKINNEIKIKHQCFDHINDRKMGQKKQILLWHVIDNKNDGSSCSCYSINYESMKVSNFFLRKIIFHFQLLQNSYGHVINQLQFNLFNGTSQLLTKFKKNFHKIIFRLKTMIERVQQGKICLEQILIENQKKQEVEIQTLLIINKTHDLMFKDFFDYLLNSQLSSNELCKNLIYLKKSLDFNIEVDRQQKSYCNLISQGTNISKLQEQLETQLKVSQEPQEIKTGIKGNILDILPVSQNQFQAYSQVRESTELEGKRLLRERPKKIQNPIKHTKEKCSICDARFIDFYGLVFHEKNYHNILRHPQELINLKIEE